MSEKDDPLYESKLRIYEINEQFKNPKLKDKKLIRFLAEKQMAQDELDVASGKRTIPTLGQIVEAEDAKAKRLEKFSKIAKRKY